MSHKFYKQVFRYTVFATMAFAATACGILNNDDNGNAGTKGIFIICEGNYGGGNASLWHLEDDYSAITQNVYETAAGMPLGDTGQSLEVAGDRLYVVMNGSHTLEILDLSHKLVEFVATVDLADASPRAVVVDRDDAYVTSWNIPGIIKINLKTFAIADTIILQAAPEDILIYDNHLLVCLADYGSGSEVVRINPVSGEVVATYVVGTGPQQLLLDDNVLYVSRQWFDPIDYTSYQGLSSINLASGDVTSNDWGVGNGVDVFMIDDQLYFTTTGGIVPVDSDLGPADATVIAADMENIYSAGTDGKNIIVGTSDFRGPGQLVVLSPDGAEVVTYTIGIGPGDYSVR